MRDTLFTASACTLAELRQALKELEDFVWLASACKANDHDATIICQGNVGVRVSIVERTLTDKSKVYDFEIKGLDTRVPQAREKPYRWQ